MKYLLVLCDGMADFPVPELDGKTSMAVASKPTMDKMSETAIIGTVKTVPDSLKPGSDTANLSALGYDAEKCYTGRSPLEALSLGIDLSDSDIAIRCNLVTLSDDEPFEEKTMIDYSAGEISTAESKQLIESLQENLGNELLHFYNGISYRHCLVLKNSKVGTELTPPHDISKQKIAKYLPQGINGERFVELYKEAQQILSNHLVNQQRIKNGKRPANSIWLWGEGTKPQLQNFHDYRNLNGSMISAVDLLKGIAIGAGMSSIDVEGATGTVRTNFDGKAQAAINEFEKGQDFVFVHLEAPDECGHQGDVHGKVKAIELIDSKILKPIVQHMTQNGESLRVLVMPDHYTPLTTLTHDRTPVPFLMWQNDKKLGDGGVFTENGAAFSTTKIDYAPDLMKMFVEK